MEFRYIIRIRYCMEIRYYIRIRYCMEFRYIIRIRYCMEFRYYMRLRYFMEFYFLNSVQMEDICHPCTILYYLKIEPLYENVVFCQNGMFLWEYDIM